MWLILYLYGTVDWRDVKPVIHIPLLQLPTCWRLLFTAVLLGCYQLIRQWFFTYGKRCKQPYLFVEVHIFKKLVHKKRGSREYLEPPLLRACSFGTLRTRQVSQASQPGKSARQAIQASHPGKPSRQVTQASHPGKSSRQVTQASHPGKSPRQALVAPYAVSNCSDSFLCSWWVAGYVTMKRLCPSACCSSLCAAECMSC